MQKNDLLPELVLSTEEAPVSARRIQRLARAGRLRRLYVGVYTSNLSSDAEAVVLRHWRAIVAHLLPGAVLSHRSAFDARPHNGGLIVTRGKTRRTLVLPGLTIEVMPGPGPRLTPPAQDPPLGTELYLASDPRRFLENLKIGKGWRNRVLPAEDIETRLDRLLMVGGERSLNQVRDAAREIAPALGLEKTFVRLDGKIGALLGTQVAKKLSATQALARAAGRPYDPDRVQLFDKIAAALHNSVLPEIADPAPKGTARDHLAFFESYFSNYIEGTTFTVDEAEDIVFRGLMIENRSEDAHDVRGTFAAATTTPWRDRPARTADDFLQWLKSVNALVMQQRPEKRPGQWKDRPNQAGSTYFVMPELVPGTLRQGFERMQSLVHPLARAILVMCIVTEVHPFMDGNGRTARLAMNCELSAAGLCRIMIPSVYREDYLLPLKALSNRHDAGPVIAAMNRIQKWTAMFDFGLTIKDIRSALKRCNAFEDDLRNFRLVDP